MSNERILIVDDDPVNLKLVKIHLQREGYELRFAADGLQALATAEAFNPELVLTDIQLPQMNGLELTRRLKSNAITQSAAVVALTACAMKGDEERAIAAGCDGYVTKPIDRGKLLTTIVQVLQSKKGAEKSRPALVATRLASADASRVVDAAELELRVGNDKDLLRDLIEIFLADSPRMREATRRAAEERNGHDLQNAAHALKGTVAIFAASRALQAATVLENMGAKDDLSDAMAAYGVLDHEVRDLCTELGRIATQVACV